jgi:hypothetical protein
MNLYFTTFIDSILASTAVSRGYLASNFLDRLPATIQEI